MRISNIVFRILAIIFLGVGAGSITYQLKTNPPNLKKTQPTRAPQWVEHERVLTDIERATMSGSFQMEFEQAFHVSPTPVLKPIFSLDVPSSMAGDLLPPTAKITGGPSDGEAISATQVCFPLYVSDNMTPWQQLATRAKMDDKDWSNWMNIFSYCYNNLSIGPHTFRMQIKDLAGNMAPDTTRLFIVKQ